MNIKRPLMCMAGGFVLGEVLGLLHVGIGMGILVIGVPGLLWLCMKRCSRRPLIWLLLFLCCVLGYGRMKAYRALDPGDSAIAVTRGKPVTLQGRVTEIAVKEKNVSMTMTDCHFQWDDLDYEMPDMVVYVQRQEFMAVDAKQCVRLGMEIAVKGVPEKPSGARNSGEFDFKSYYESQGIYYQMFGEKLEVRRNTYWGYRDGLYRLRLAAGRVLEEICEPQDTGIFQAAVLGDKTSLDEEVRDLYQRSGISHLLAISGLHISMVGLGVYRMLRRAGLGYGFAGVLGTVVIISYGILTGGSSSVIRAVMMVLVCMLAEYLGRSYDMLSAAALACILLLWDSPGILTQAGFQLSFGAVAAIGGLGPWIAHGLGTTGGRGKALVMGASVQLVTGPMILYHFFQFPVYGILLNLVVIPLMAYVIVSGIAGIALGSLWPSAGVLAVGSGHYILEFYLWLCRLCERLPGSNLVMGRPRLWQIGLYAVLLATLLWLICGRKRPLPGAEPPPGTECRPLIGRQPGVLAVGAVVCFLVMWQLPVRGLEVTFLDVGQGDGMCVRTEDVVILVDGGSSDKKQLGKNTMEPYLKSLGIRQVDYAVVSHADTDHVSGLLYLLEESRDIRIRNLILPWWGRDDDSYQALVTLMQTQGGRVHWMQEGEVIRAGDLSLTCLYHGDEADRKETNEHSLVLQLAYDGMEMLLTGDMGSEGERKLLEKNRLSRDGYFLLKAGHHGSQYSTCEAFLEQTAPEWTVISCGEDNSYGHPHREVLERLHAQGSKILVTEDTGAITVHCKDGHIRLRTFLQKNTG